jgi:hypothetical protein
MKTTSSLLLAAACALLIMQRAVAQDYHSNDLTPPGAGSGKLAASSNSGKQVGSAQVANSYAPHAYLLTGNALTAIDLNPTGAYQSMATCLDDSQQGGWTYFPTGIHATVWNGSSSSYADLNPSGYNFSYCYGIDNGEQVGYAQQQSYFITASHAFCWHGSAISGIDLHAGTYSFSRALGCKSGEQVGYVSTIAYAEGEQLGYHTGSRAVVWHGSAASAVDVHPVGFDASEATCTNGTQQGGWGYIALGTSHQHALIWQGTADTVVDLHPAGYSDSRINAMSATKQVGEGWVGVQGTLGAVRHALAWSGTADRVVDLNQYLPAGYTHGVATGVDSNGNVVGYAYNNFNAGLYIPLDAVAVVFAPGAAPATQLASITLSKTNVAPGDTLQATVTLGGAAPAGGVNINFLSGNTALLATPADVVIAEGETSATLDLTTTTFSLQSPTSIKLYASDGSVSRSAPLAITPVVNLSSLTGNTVEGGFTSTVGVYLSIPAQAGGAVVSLSSSNPSVLSVPASVTIPQGWAGVSANVTTYGVSVETPVTVTGTFNGKTASATFTLSPAPVVALSTVSIPNTVGGQSIYGSVTLNNFSRSSTGTTVTLTSSDTKLLQAPATVVIPYGSFSTSFIVNTTVVSGAKTVSLTAKTDNSSVSTSATLNPIPPITLVSADWDPDTLLFKVQADSPDLTAILTFGTTAANGPIGTMQYELGTFKGSILMPTAPTTATVWSSYGAQASMSVTIKGVKSAGGGGTKTGGTATGGTATGGTTTGGTTTSSTYKVTTGKTGKGTVTMSPAGPTFAAGTVVTLTATPDAGSPWIGWTGSVTSKSQTITVTVNSNLSLTANFK